MPPMLAPEIANYVTADNSGDANRFGQCFAEHAAVRDEGHTYLGRPAIQSWHVTSKAKYQHHLEPIAAVEVDGRTIVTMRLSGHFPGSPVDIDFAFRLSDGKIAMLEIGL